jgi:hypothetical protein
MDVEKLACVVTIVTGLLQPYRQVILIESLVHEFRIPSYIDMLILNTGTVALTNHMVD